MSLNQVCNSCGAREISIFYKLNDIPANSVLLLHTREESMIYPKGDISLGLCNHCGFISNVTFNPSLLEYSFRYEGTQAYSDRFHSFLKDLAGRLIERHNLHRKNIIEIGCGQGEFLTLLCNLGENRGIGFDPAYSGRGSKKKKSDRIIFIKDFYSEKYSQYHADFICCRMTLEHIQRTADFVRTLRRSIEKTSKTVVFFQVPNVRRILRELAFWDIYYEHCSYFSLGSLARLFRNCGFDIIELWKDYDDQYLMIEAKPINGERNPPLSQENDLEELAGEVDYFAAHFSLKQDEWHKHLNEIKQKKERAVIWGGGSKGVAFLTTLKIQDEIEYVVDINPHKQGTYMAGTGHPVVAPEFLRKYKPDIVIAMNPIYCEEIQQKLKTMKLKAKVMPVL